MPTLGDFFPQEDKKTQLQAALKPGNVFYLHQDFFNRAKDKYFLLAVCADPPLFFVINSDIPPFIASRPELKMCQILLQATDYPQMLAHDSYVDCKEVIEHFSLAEIEAQVLADMSRLKGSLHRESLQKIQDAVENSTLIEPGYRKLILVALTELLQP
ncbi:MAG: hypothetical protein HOP19_11840 [Acidobacteria bacterium]|nr:hypothetical protein [Acidobacteriota bacterium]